MSTEMAAQLSIAPASDTSSDTSSESAPTPTQTPMFDTCKRSSFDELDYDEFPSSCARIITTSVTPKIGIQTIAPTLTPTLNPTPAPQMLRTKLGPTWDTYGEEKSCHHPRLAPVLVAVRAPYGPPPQASVPVPPITWPPTL